MTQSLYFILIISSRRTCFPLCLFVSKTTEPTVTEFGGKATNWPLKKRLDFGGKPEFRITLR